MKKGTAFVSSFIINENVTTFNIVSHSGDGVGFEVQCESSSDDFIFFLQHAHESKTFEYETNFFDTEKDERCGEKQPICLSTLISSGL